MIPIRLNGISRQIPVPSTILDILTLLQLPNMEYGVAVCLNDEIIPKPQWGLQQIQEGDVLEVVHATQGG